MHIAILQDKPVTAPPVEALARLDAALLQARAEGADLLVTPEMFLSGYAVGAATISALADRAQAQLWQPAAALAAKHDVALVTGGPRRNGEMVFNTARLFDSAGRELASHDKTQLFGPVDRAQFAPGRRRAGVVDLKGWNVSLAICYEIEFPETARALALDGADLILVPTANMLPFDSVATRLVPARAEENGVYVAYANYVGSEGGFEYCGLSCLCGPDGNDLARAGRGQALIFADLDKAHLQSMRTRTPYLADRRSDLYGNG